MSGIHDSLRLLLRAKQPALLTCMLVLCNAVAATANASTRQVSVDSDGNPSAQLNSEQVSTSADGRYVVFSSEAENLVPNDTNRAPDIFLHDTITGETRRISVSNSASQADGVSRFPSISDDGRYIAYNSSAPNLVDGDTNDEFDIFLYDRTSRETVRVSTDSSGAQALAGDSFTPALSADGTIIAYHSAATNLVANDSNGVRDIFVHDRRTGRTERANVSSSGAQADGGDSRAASISDDGRYVAFQSQAGNLVAGDNNASFDVFVRDLELGLTTIVSVSSAGEPSQRGSSRFPALSGDGRVVAYQSSSASLVPDDTNGMVDVFVTELSSGETTRVSTNSDGLQASGGDSTSASISYDGRLVVFSSAANNLVENDSNGVADVFLHDRQTGETTRISNGLEDTQANGGPSLQPHISGSGRFVAFESDAFNIVANDTNNARDVFQHDRGIEIDADADAVPNYRDADSDNDGILDTVEAGADLSTPRDSDGDGIPDLADLDSDNDGASDLVETENADLDDDGRIDDFVDSDGNGVDDAFDAVPNTLIDSDADGLFDYLDTDSNNDGISDAIDFGYEDGDGDGVIDNFIDTDQDGRHDIRGREPVDLDDSSSGSGSEQGGTADSNGGGGATVLGMLLLLPLLLRGALRLAPFPTINSGSKDEA